MTESEFGCLPNFFLGLSIYVGRLSSFRESNSFQAFLLQPSGEIPRRLQRAQAVIALRRGRSDRKCFNLIYPRHVEHLKATKIHGVQDASLANRGMSSKARAIAMPKPKPRPSLQSMLQNPEGDVFHTNLFSIVERYFAGRRRCEQKQTGLTAKRAGH